MVDQNKPQQKIAGMSTLLTHLGEFENPQSAHVMPIYQTSAFCFPDASSGAKLFRGEQEGYIYTRLGNPNQDLLAKKIAALESAAQISFQTVNDFEPTAAGLVFSSGMAAISATILALVKAGDVIVAQRALYGNTYLILDRLAPRLGIRVIWVDEVEPESWEAAFSDHPGAVLAYLESPVNPTMEVIDIKCIAEIAHLKGAWVLVDNTFATPYCQRPLALGADVVLHSTTKYLSGHGAVVGGAAVSPHLDFVQERLVFNQRYLGATASPMDAWLSNLGLKTFELRMERHCQNALEVAQYLENHPAVAEVHYPGLESHPGYHVACKQMTNFGGMLSFELKNGYQAGERLMNHVQVATLAVSLGNLDTLIQHPASMTHSSVPREERQSMGISDGLVRLSVGIENVADLLEDLDQALNKA